MKQEHILFRKNIINNKPTSKEEIIKMFVKLWYDYTKKRKDCIIKGFKMTGISTKMVGRYKK